MEELHSPDEHLSILAMRVLLPLTLLLFACQSAPTTEELQTALEARSLEFAGAMANADLDAGLALASADAVRFFEAQQKLFAMIGEDDLEVERAPEPDIQLVSAQHDGQHGKGVLVLTSEGEATDMILHFVLEDGEWRVLGFADALDDEPTLLADLAPAVLAQVKLFEEERTPHPHIAPLVEAYLEAAAAQDLDGMLAGMTDGCREDQGRATAWTQSFARGEVTLVEWEYSRKEGGDQAGEQTVRVLVRSPDGETDGDRMGFQAASFDGVWKITGLD